MDFLLCRLYSCERAQFCNDTNVYFQTFKFRTSDVSFGLMTKIFSFLMLLTDQMCATLSIEWAMRKKKSIHQKREKENAKFTFKFLS